MWLDMDLLIDKMDFVMPLDSYAGKDLIMHGQAEYILQGEARKGELPSPASCQSVTEILKEMRHGCLHVIHYWCWLWGPQIIWMPVTTAMSP